MTRKEYQLVAAEFRRIKYMFPELPPQMKNMLDYLRIGLAIALAKENPKFNHYKFNKACGEDV